MTAGHALFAGAMSAYVLVGIWFEEQGLLEAFGDTYREYRRETPVLVPRPFGG
jgi:protein-S-isoprenylcysteine O-methyltransferase Ste14